MKNKALILSTYIPLVLLLSTGVFWLTASLELGHFPVYSAPDPKTIHLNWHKGNILGFLILLPLSFIIVLFSIKQINRNQLLRYVFPFLILILLFFTNFMDIANWLMD